jgi:hypothetical protein
MFPSRRLCTPSKANILMLPLRPAIEGRRPSTAAPLDDIMAGLEYNLRELAKQPYRRALLDEVTSDLVQLLCRLARRSESVEQLIDELFVAALQAHRESIAALSTVRIPAVEKAHTRLRNAVQASTRGLRTASFSRAGHRGSGVNPGSEAHPRG